MISIQDYHQGINYLNMGCNSGGTHKNNYNKALLYILLGQSDSALTQTKKAIKRKNPSDLGTFVMLFLLCPSFMKEQGKISLLLGLCLLIY